MTDAEIIAELRDWAFNAAADRIEALVREKRWIMEESDIDALQARAERLEAALRAVQTYLAEPAPEDKVNDLKSDLRWVSHRVNAALKGDGHE
jgi:hypothetical protein